MALAPSNEWGGFYFMSILTGKKIHAYKWTKLPINDEVIDQVHALAEAEDQPELMNGSVFFEWRATPTREDNTVTTQPNYTISDFDADGATTTDEGNNLRATIMNDGKLH